MSLHVVRSAGRWTRVPIGPRRRLRRPPPRARIPPRAEMAGQYHESFDDISKHLTDLFTYKAVKTVLAQLQETDPTNYKYPFVARYLYNFSVENRPSQSYVFCKLLIKEKRELGERILTTRLNLLSEWSNRVERTDLEDYVTDMNLKILRASLQDSVNFVFTAKPRPDLNE